MFFEVVMNFKRLLCSALVCLLTLSALLNLGCDTNDCPPDFSQIEAQLTAKLKSIDDNLKQQTAVLSAAANKELAASIENEAAVVAFAIKNGDPDVVIAELHADYKAQRDGIMQKLRKDLAALHAQAEKERAVAKDAAEAAKEELLRQCAEEGK